MSWQEYCNQASLAVSQGNYAEAERFIYEAFKEARQEKNLERIYTALDLLGWLAFMQTKYDDAEKIYQYVAKVKVQLFGADHVEIAKTLKNLIAAAYQVKQYERVVPYAKEASRIFAANLGAAHPECQAIAGNLFELLKWLNRPGEAEEVRISYLAPPPIQPTAPPMAQLGQTGSGAQTHQAYTGTGQFNQVGQQQAAQAQQSSQSGGYAQAQPQQQQYQQNPATGQYQTGQQQAQPAQQAQTNYGTGTGQYSNLAQQQQQPQQQQAQQANYGTGTGQYSNLAAQQQQPQQAQQAAYGTGTGQYSDLSAQQAQQAQAQQAAQQAQAQQAAQQAQQAAQQALAQQAAQQAQLAAQQAQQAAAQQAQYAAQQAYQAQQAAQQQYQQPIAPTQGQAGSAPPPGSKSDYSKYAKSICEVCQYEYDGPECLRCTSGQLTVFDPNSRLNW